MGIAICNALALAFWRGFESFNSSLTTNNILWMLIGAVIAVLVMWVISRRRRRWF
jgi:LPXTG-motif cell wall-anchored protein